MVVVKMALKWNTMPVGVVQAVVLQQARYEKAQGLPEPSVIGRIFYLGKLVSANYQTSF
jgi:hypothetical protein